MTTEPVEQQLFSMIHGFHSYLGTLCVLQLLRMRDKAAALDMVTVNLPATSGEYFLRRPQLRLKPIESQRCF